MNVQNQIKNSTNESTLLSSNDMPSNQKSQSKYGRKPEGVQEDSIKQGGVSANSITFKKALHTDDLDESLHKCINKYNIQLSW